MEFSLRAVILFIFLLAPLFCFAGLEYNDLILQAQQPEMSDQQRGAYRNLATQIYNEMNPYYAEVCTATQYLPHVPRATKGGTGGHATLFLQGACLDESSEYPKLKMCDETTPQSDPHKGVGVSLNLMFSNVRFVAIPGRDNFFKGPEKWGQAITPEVVEKTRAYYFSKPWHNNIKIASEERDGCSCINFKCLPNELKQCLIDKNTGIDFAISYARTSYCTKLPLPKEALAKIVSHLNKQNTQAYIQAKNGKRGYKYDVLLDNCSHLIHNALASTGFFDPKKQLSSNLINKLRALPSEWLADLGFTYFTGGEFGYMSVPIHNFNRIAQRSIKLPVKIPELMWKNKDVSKTLSRYSWIPSGSGNMIEVIGMRTNNSSFDEGEVGVGFLLAKEDFEQFTNPYDSDFKPYYSDLCQNLQFHKDNLNTALSKTSMWLTSLSSKMRFNKRQFYKTYNEAIGISLSKVNDDLDIYRSHGFSCD